MPLRAKTQAVQYPWRGTPPDKTGYPHYGALEKADRQRGETYARLLQARRRERQSILLRGGSAWKSRAEMVRREFSKTLGFQILPSKATPPKPTFVRTTLIGGLHETIPEWASRIHARSFTVPQAAWEGGDIELLLLSASGGKFKGGRRPAVLIIPDCGVSLTGAQSPESAIADWGGELSRNGFVVGVAALPGQKMMSSTRNKQRLLEGGCAVGEVAYEAAGALGALIELAGPETASVWVVGKGFGALVAIALAAVDPRVSGVLADAPVRWGHPDDSQVLLAPRWHAVTDLHELCALIAPRPIAFMKRQSRPSGFVPALADVESLASAAKPAYRSARGATGTKVFSAAQQANAIEWMTETSLKARMPKAAAANAVRTIRPKRAFALTKFTRASDWLSARRELRRRYLQEVSGISKKAIPLSVTVVSRRDLPGYSRTEYHVRTGPLTYANVLFMAPHDAQRRRTTILCLPGSGSDVAKVETNYAHEVTAQGWNACVMDARAALYRSFPGLAEERAIISQSLYDLMCCMNWMCERDDVDVKRIGSMGVSQGGSHTWMLAAVDERISAAAPVCGICSFKSYVQNYRNEWYGGDYISFLDGGTIYYCTPGVLSLGEQQDLVGLIAPRPLLFIGANHDAWFPLDGMRESRDDLQHIYRLLGASKNFEYVEFEGEHSMPEHTRRKAYAFFRKHLD